jgi:twinkle protein
MTALSDAAIRWAARDRKISQQTLEDLGVESGTKGGREVLCFPYVRGSEIVNTKYRTLAEKTFSMREGGELRFWNLDAVLGGDLDTVWIFEGELDVLAAREVGLRLDRILSVPNGAPRLSSDNPLESDRYAYVVAALAEGLNRAKRFILATDGDGPGLALRHDLVQLFGPARCWFVDWPAGAKDLNDLLIAWDQQSVREYLEEAPREWPIDGLYRLSDLPERPPFTIWQPGFPEWENKILLAPGVLSVFTGYPGHGKTLLASQMWFNVCRAYNQRAAIASFETSAKPHHERNMRQFYWGKPAGMLDDAQRAKADEWNNEHFLWMQHRERRPTFKWFLNMAETAVIRHGARIVQLDPFNKVEWERPDGKRETDWIRDCLNEALNFAKDFDVHVQIVAHPSKTGDPNARKDKPTLEDIAGSRHWDNIVDQGFCVFRKKMFDGNKRNTDARLFHLKSRFEELGHPCSVELNYNLQSRRYESVDYAPAWTYQSDDDK